MAEIAGIRTVRLLDREPRTVAAPPKTGEKRVGGILIEKGVPIRPRTNNRPNTILNAMRAMEVGESFVWRKRVNTDAIKQARPFKFVQRKVGNGPAYRIWRTA